MLRASFSVSTLLATWLLFVAAKPGTVAWNLATPDHVLRIIRVAPAGEKAPELGVDWPAIRTHVSLSDGRDAWIWDVARKDIPTAKRYELKDLILKPPLADVVCSGCTEDD